MQKRIEAYGVRIGELPRGRMNKITDVDGVCVGHATIDTDRHKTGVTVIMPCEDNMFVRKLTAAAFVLNGFGKSQGLIQIDELGTMETPIALTNTLNVGLVHDAMVDYMIDRCKRDGESLRSINPVIGECNDASLSDICERAVHKTHVLEAIESAVQDFEEGDVGAGKGTSCHGLKGGIGSASRVMQLGGEAFTLGVLVQSNYGSLSDLRLDGRNIGSEIAKLQQSEGKEEDKGSIMIVLATDLPLSSRQLRRVIKRTSVGLARLGSYIGHGSGEIMIGFTTANRWDKGEAFHSMRIIDEGQINVAFRAAAEACEEAVLNSMVCAHETKGYSGQVRHSLGDYLERLL